MNGALPEPEKVPIASLLFHGDIIRFRAGPGAGKYAVVNRKGQQVATNVWGAIHTLNGPTFTLPDEYGANNFLRENRAMGVHRCIVAPVPTQYALDDEEGRTAYMVVSLLNPTLPGMAEIGWPGEPVYPDTSSARPILNEANEIVAWESASYETTLNEHGEEIVVKRK